LSQGWLTVPGEADGPWDNQPKISRRSLGQPAENQPTVPEPTVPGTTSRKSADGPWDDRKYVILISVGITGYRRVYGMKKTGKYTEEEKRDLNQIMALLTTFDHSRNKHVEKAAEYAGEHCEFATKYGEEYLERVRGICSDNEQSRSCIVCHEKYAKNRIICASCAKKLKKADMNPVHILVDKIDDIVGGDGFVELRWKDLFTNVFKKHTIEEAEKIFICGTEETTPKPSQMSDEWIKPWLYSRVAFVMFIAFWFLFLAVGLFGNSNSVPGMIFMGSMVIPFSVLVLFFEINAPRNISIFNTIMVFFVGGCASIFVALILYCFVPISSEYISLFMAVLIGLVEELAKLFLTVYFLKRLKKNTYLLNGLLIGAAVGAGFAVFESAGYAFNGLIQTANVSEGVGGIVLDFTQMFFTIVLRGLLSPGNHIVWTAMAGFGAVSAMKKYGYRIRGFFTKKFLAIFFIPVILHALWDWSLPLPLTIKCSVLVIVAWIVIFVFVDNGLDEINIITREGIYVTAEKNE